MNSSDKRSNKECPIKHIDIPGALSDAWRRGWMNEFSDDHFLIKAIEGRLEKFEGINQFVINNCQLYHINDRNFQECFCINLSCSIAGLKDFFGENKVRQFFIDQLSAGKEKYDESQFFRALSEISVLRFWVQRSKFGEYEPRTNGQKNPEARFICNNGVTVDVEVKTPGFNKADGIENFVLPLVLLNNEGQDQFVSFCNSKSLKGIMPRVGKLKDFLNSASDKFESVDHVNHMNFLYINWTFSEMMESGFEEALSLLAHPYNGILLHKDIGLSIGVKEEVYDRITAVIVYTEPLNSLMFDDFRYVWTKGADGMPHFGIVGMHNCDSLYKITGMNPFGRKLTPIIYYFSQDAKYFDELERIIAENLLTNGQT